MVSFQFSERVWNFWQWLGHPAQEFRTTMLIRLGQDAQATLAGSAATFKTRSQFSVSVRI
jgi:hypothetical protein